jgi:hypothetical protein
MTLRVFSLYWQTTLRQWSLNTILSADIGSKPNLQHIISYYQKEMGSFGIPQLSGKEPYKELQKTAFKCYLYHLVRGSSYNRCE